MSKLIPIVYDTAEQRPWTFPTEQFTAERRKIRTGDYSIVGFEDVITIERKSLGDLVSTVIHDWIRFRKELVRMSGFDHAMIVVEANVEDLMQHKYESEALPQSVMGKVQSIYFDHGIATVFWGPRTVCEPLVWQWFAMAAKKVGMP